MIKELTEIRNELLTGVESSDLLYIKMQINKIDTLLYNASKNNGALPVVIGRNYGGEGYSGMTDGVDVKGKLIEVDQMRASATIWSDKLDMPCAIKLRSLYAL